MSNDPIKNMVTLHGLMGKGQRYGNRSRHTLWFNVRNIQHVVVLRYFQEALSPVSCCTVTKTPCFVRFQAVNGYKICSRLRGEGFTTKDIENPESAKELETPGYSKPRTQVRGVPMRINTSKPRTQVRGGIRTPETTRPLARLVGGCVHTLGNDPLPVNGYKAGKSGS